MCQAAMRSGLVEELQRQLMRDRMRVCRSSKRVEGGMLMMELMVEVRSLQLLLCLRSRCAERPVSQRVRRRVHAIEAPVRRRITSNRRRACASEAGLSRQMSAAFERYGLCMDVCSISGRIEIHAMTLTERSSGNASSNDMRRRKGVCGQGSGRHGG
jgi:hypothetical protein